MRHAPMILLLCLAPLATVSCSDEPDGSAAPATQATEEAPTQIKTAQAPPPVDFDDLPPIPVIEYERINEEPVQAELRRARENALANQSDPRAVGALGMKCFVYDFSEEARDCFLIASAMAPRSYRWLYYLAISHEDVGEPDLAIQTYEHAIALDASYQPAYVRLAKLMLDVDRERACELYEQAARIMPGEARATWGLAQCARLADDFELAESLYRDAIRAEPGFAEAHFGLAQILARTGRTDEAQIHFALQSAGKPASDYRDPLAVRLALAEGGTSGIIRDANARARQGDVPGAIKQLNDALADYPNHPGLRLQIAQLMLSANRLDAAKEQIRLVLAKLPENIGALSMLGAIAMQQGETDESERLFREALRIKPDDAASNWVFGQLLLQQGRFDEALGFITRGADLQALNPAIQAQAARLFEQLGELPKAAAFMRRAAIVSSGNEALVREAERLEQAAESDAPIAPKE